MKEKTEIIRCSGCFYYTLGTEHYCAYWTEITGKRIYPPWFGYCYHCIERNMDEETDEETDE